MMLAGFEYPTEGEIWLGDTLINNWPPYKRQIGMVFQNYALFPHMTVAQNVGYALTVRRTPSAVKRSMVRQALEMVRMTEYANRRPAMLSGGQQQRVALARAVVFRPRLVLMDEPLGALDKRLREEMQIELKDLHRQLGITFVYVTHDQSEALTMSDRVAVFEAGRIQQIDKVHELYEMPINRNVAHFVGDNNVFCGIAEKIKDQWYAITLQGGQRLKGRVGHKMRIGEKAHGCIRPERIILLNKEGDKSEYKDLSNKLQAKAKDLIYFGDHIQVRLMLDEQNTVLVKVHPGNPMLNFISAGEQVLIGFAAEHFHIFP